MHLSGAPARASYRMHRTASHRMRRMRRTACTPHHPPTPLASHPRRGLPNPSRYCLPPPLALHSRAVFGPPHLPPHPLAEGPERSLPVTRPPLFREHADDSTYEDDDRPLAEGATSCATPPTHRAIGSSVGCSAAVAGAVGTGAAVSGAVEVSASEAAQMLAAERHNLTGTHAPAASADDFVDIIE